MIRYLYVEDDEDIREIVASMMEATHREITAVADGEAALSLMPHWHDFDLLVTDVSLPGVSGMDLARRWLAQDNRRSVLLLSGYEFGHGLAALGPNVRSLLKSSAPEDLEAAMLKLEAGLAAG